jgi:tRNA (mo5U34)-methyltransferase
VFGSQRRKLLRALHEVPYWHHSIDLGHGVVTAGRKDAAYHALELEAMRLPSLAGKTVLDVGTWDGYYAFLAEARGARRVVALDSFVWDYDLSAWGSAEWRVAHPGRAPGRRGFDLARAALRSKVEPVHLDVDRVDPETVGTFDVVLLLGVIYHMRHPLAALERMRSVTEGVMVVESTVCHYPGLDETPMWRFYEGRELNDDPSNWWEPNVAGLTALLRAAGFARVEQTGTMGFDRQAPPDREHHYRVLLHAHVA